MPDAAAYMDFVVGVETWCPAWVTIAPLGQQSISKRDVDGTSNAYRLKQALEKIYGGEGNVVVGAVHSDGGEECVSSSF